MPLEIPPSPLQQDWLNAELGLFCHFGINTFFDREWSDGSLPAEGFNPSDFDAQQWVEVAQRGGFRYLILTAKHHDGFCLWPTETTDYSVINSPWKHGHGDVVGEVAEACREGGIRFGLYLSPWDRHEPSYYNPSLYDRFYCQQLHELCTRYGELFELWFDGAGSEYRVYDWPRIMEVIDQHQPNAMIFNMGRPTIRWAGNEDGVASDPNYLTSETLGVSAFAEDRQQTLNEARCLPVECDVPIRSNWFWHPDDWHTLKSVEHLLGIYYRSVGLGANLLLNMGVDHRGRIADEDRDRWLEAWDLLQKRFEAPCPAAIRVDGDLMRLEFEQPIILDHLMLSEDLSCGQKIDGFTILDPKGKQLCSGRTIGHKRIIPTRQCKVNQYESLMLIAGNADARLRHASAYQTGFQTIPRLGPKLNYHAWSQKTT